MEDFKEKIPMIIVAVIVIALMVTAFYFLAIHKDIYYTKIDNTKIEEISSSDDMKYQYKLTAYNKNGNSNQVEFKTSRQLKEGAYLELEVMSIRGVINWKEVQINEIPNKVKKEFNIE